MRHLAALALVAFAAAGCIGSGTDKAIPPSSDRNLAVPWSKTVVTITYSAPRCPPGARCSAVKANSSSAQVVRVVRNLRCDPPGSGPDYNDPAAACRALTDIVTKLGKKDWACSCPGNGPNPLPKAVGVYQGKQTTIPLDGCALCNLHGIGDDLKVLLPGATK